MRRIKAEKEEAEKQRLIKIWTNAKENCWDIDGKQYSYLLDAKKAVVFARIAKRRRLTCL